MSAMKQQVQAEEIVNQVGPIAIPREDDGGESDNGVSVLTGRGPITIRRPDPQDWIHVHRRAAIKVRLAKVQVPNQYEPDWYYVRPELRAGLLGVLRLYSVVPYWSTLRGRPYLWVAATDGEHGWADSLYVLFGQTPEWHDGNTVRIEANRDEARYSIQSRNTKIVPDWPNEPTEVLLPEALGPNRIISDVSHPKYATILNAGEVLV